MKIDLTKTVNANNLASFAPLDISFNRDIYVDIFKKDGDVYFYTPDKKGKIKIDQDKLWKFIKGFEEKEKK